jgi:hypothetical protein
MAVEIANENRLAKKNFRNKTSHEGFSPVMEKDLSWLFYLENISKKTAADLRPKSFRPPSD